MLKSLRLGVAAGIMISIGGAVYLSCDSKYIGAILFTVALLSICIRGYALFTGKVGFIVESHKKDDVASLMLALLGNLIGTVLCGVLLRAAIPQMGDTAEAICTGKLTQMWASTLVRAFFCGVLMYIAVSIYREKKTIVGILFAIPVFILSGFEHSIADMFYFAASGIVSPGAFGFIWIVIIGNAVGAVTLPALTYERGEGNKNDKK